ncbi:addiction module antidote protein [Rhizorhabdus sp.]|uniref:addiction module antidote protein n=1 Tax=Rhizorhabdus sp. TaxID=1968843 RepID=UPI0019CF25F7|nr:addiction module antidote protein [Rhizorhabdus sp.]MBD3762483.1 putative addiction module antidote protein [Rhizorhabdus sp.]
MAIELLPYDSADYFKEPEDQADLIHDAIESGDAGYLAHALGVVARARGMTQLERDTGMKRQALYRALSKEGNPTLDTVMKVTKALGLRLAIDPVAPSLAIDIYNSPPSAQRLFVIDINKDAEVTFWTEKLGVTKAKLKAAVKKAGPHVTAVAEELHAY